jgi:hypothetical protein
MVTLTIVCNTRQPLWMLDSKRTMECERRKELELSKQQADVMVFRLGSLDNIGRFYSNLSAQLTSDVLLLSMMCRTFRVPRVLSPTRKCRQPGNNSRVNTSDRDGRPLPRWIPKNAHVVGYGVEFTQSPKHSSNVQCGNYRFWSSNRLSVNYYLSNNSEVIDLVSSF